MKKFSLMELLVVMGIILLLMSILLPTVGPMISRAEMNRIASTIIGQLEVGYLKSLERNQVTRVSFEYDPIGKNINKSEVLKITSAAPKSTESEDRQNINFDINGDGVSGGFVNRQYFWLKVYLCKSSSKGMTYVGPGNDKFGNPRAGQATVDPVYIRKNLDLEDAQGPFWLRKPVARVKDDSGKFIPSKITMRPIKDDSGIVWYYRPVCNQGLDLGGVDILLPIDINNQCTLIDDSAGNILDRSLNDDGMKALPDGNVGIVTYKNSVALYQAKNGSRYLYDVGSTVNADKLAKLKLINPLYDQKDVPNCSTNWYDNFEGEMVEPELLDYGKNDDEDKMIDEGMSVSVENYNESGAGAVVLDFLAVPPILHNNYFSNIEDNNMKVGKEYFIGGKDKKGVMLRRVWGVKPNKVDKVLLWAYDKYLPSQLTTAWPSPAWDLLKQSTPFFFSIVFDQKNGSGMYFSNTYGSTQVGKLFFQLADDDNKISVLIKFEEGSAKEGTLTEMGFPTSKAGQDAIDYYQGVR